MPPGACAGAMTVGTLEQRVSITQTEAILGQTPRTSMARFRKWIFHVSPSFRRRYVPYNYIPGCGGRTLPSLFLMLMIAAMCQYVMMNTNAMA